LLLKERRAPGGKRHGGIEDLEIGFHAHEIEDLTAGLEKLERERDD